MRLRRLWGWVLVGCAPLPAPSPPAQAPTGEQVLQRVCTRCHGATEPPSTEAGAWVRRHAPEARTHLDFARFAELPNDRRRQALQNVLEVLDEGAMPPPEYLRLDPAARLTSAERAALRAWAADELK